MTKPYRVTLTSDEVEAYRSSRRLLRSSFTRLEIRHYTEVCFGIIQRGRERYVANLEREVNADGTQENNGR